MNKSLHFPVSREKFFNVPIYCRPLRNMSPMKPAVKDVEKSNIGGKESEDESENQKKDIPGLTRSQQKKALKKAQNKKKDEDKKEAKKDVKMNRSNFLKTPADDFVFNDDDSSSDDETEKGFFTKSPGDNDTPALLKYRIPGLKRQHTSPLEGNQKSRSRSEAHN